MSNQVTRSFKLALDNGYFDITITGPDTELDRVTVGNFTRLMKGQPIGIEDLGGEFVEESYVRAEREQGHTVLAFLSRDEAEALQQQRFAKNAEAVTTDGDANADEAGA